MAHRTTEATAFDVHERVLELRDLAESEPLVARDRACAWIRGLSNADPGQPGGRVPLDHVFRAGSAERIDGLAEVTILPALRQRFYPAAFAVLDRWSPLLAKDFAGDGGSNIVGPVLGGPLAVVLGGSRHPNGCSTLPFRATIEPSVGDPQLAVLALDHGAIAHRAGVLLSRMRDEVTMIVPGVYLLKPYLRLARGRWQPAPMFELLRTAG